MTAEEAFAEAYAELEQVKGINAQGEAVMKPQPFPVDLWIMAHKVCPNCGAELNSPYANVFPHVTGACKPELRILPAEEPPAKIGLGTIIAVSWIGLWAGLRVITFLVGRYL